MSTAETELTPGPLQPDEVIRKTEDIVVGDSLITFGSKLEAGRWVADYQNRQLWPVLRIRFQTDQPHRIFELGLRKGLEDRRIGASFREELRNFQAVTGGEYTIVPKEAASG